MPQMKPMNWLFLMSYNMFLLLIMNYNLFYFNYNINIMVKKDILKMNFIKFNLKW